MSDSEPVSEPTRASNEYEKFLREFIAIFKDLRILWDKTYPDYNNKTERSNAMEILSDKCIEYFPDASYEFARNKLETIRGCFRREYKKVQKSRETAKSPDDIYKPTLWYYNLLLFLVGETPDQELEPFQLYGKTSYWTREHTLVLIDLLKTQPIFYQPNSYTSSKEKKLTALKKIADGLTAETGKKFDLAEIKRKIQMLKDQYRRERRIMRTKKSKMSSLWCYELLSFLKCDTTKKIKKVSLEKSDEGMGQVPEIPNGVLKETKHFNTDETVNDDTSLYDDDDIFDTIGKNIARKLREMTEEQRNYAINLINEVLYQGLMGNLTWDSRLVIKDN